MKKRNNKKIKQRNNIKKSPPLPCIVENNGNLNLSGDLYSFCSNLIKTCDNDKKIHSPDYYFSIAIIAKETKNFQLERQAILNLLFFIKNDCSELLSKIVNNEHSFELTEKTEFLISLKELSSSEAHYYFKIILGFIISATKQQITAYFNCFMGRSSNSTELIALPSVVNLPNEVLLDFYEITHRLLIDKSPSDEALKKLTSFIYNSTDGTYSKSLLFFLSFFNLNSNDSQAIEFANLYINTPNLSLDICNYSQSIAWNTAHAAIRIGDIDEAEYWLAQITDEEKSTKIEGLINSLYERVNSRIQHPLNPENNPPVDIDDISTIHLISLNSFIYGCGDDWGLKELYRSGRYIFPSDMVTNDMFKSLSLNGVIKISINDFNSLNENELNDFNQIINNRKFHINIRGVTDTKLIAQKIIFEEIEKREDKYEAALAIWKHITLGYFYNSMEFYLSNVKDDWAKDFTLNEITIERIKSSNISAQILHYLAKTSIRYSAGKYSIGETYGNKHIRNTLIGSINRNLDWIENGNFIDNSYPRGKKQPVLAAERVLEIICGITAESLYDNSPELMLCQTCGYVGDEDF
ncbi:TPA: hypothetical protein ACVBYD_004272 [Yersinia enterocolitica]|uniref:hypothetical protein n=1 Tax=Yersinia enterocolitica TaxID=630 RepID=UPI0005FAE9C5|nr:hypothetical protein [Yersinia enterocolitica]EKN3386362.1 hypothetical protein [Yersinia enterocolitica]EKN3587764.1 hypothetical protein [Yersinia enterocolitica]EKN3768016.1 hypothetical protein [Yersinia enterocolitica]EKN4020141.1 hypothetical protein [Yersinia enterocolitica]EKN4082847.1 hypothetical protein [Yersinia enterocolitica]